MSKSYVILIALLYSGWVSSLTLTLSNGEFSWWPAIFFFGFWVAVAKYGDHIAKTKGKS